MVLVDCFLWEAPPQLRVVLPQSTPKHWGTERNGHKTTTHKGKIKKRHSCTVVETASLPQNFIDKHAPVG